MKSKVCVFEKMNTDISDRFLPEGVYRNMINCRVGNLNEEGGGVVKNIKSTLAITPPDYGTGIVPTYIGGCLYSKASSVIAFKKHGVTLFITSYNIKTGVETILYKAINTIDCTKRITHSVVLDDLLYWVDGAGKIRKINLATIAVTDALTSEQMMIDKFPPMFPPTTESKVDATFSGNNITDTTFQFAYCWEYEDKEVSSYSPFSKSVIPFTADDENFPRNAIDVTVRTGDLQVTKIYIAYRQGNDKDWLLAEKLDKEELVISDDTTYVYRFYNDSFLSGLVQTKVLTNTNNPFYWFGALTLTKDNFLVAGLLKDGLTKPTGLTLALTKTILSTTVKIAGYKFGAKHKFGAIFRDENGRTDGVDATAEIEIPFFTDGDSYTTVKDIVRTTHNPYVNIGWEITGSAPSWAKSMSIVYLGNSTLVTFIQHVTKAIEDVGIYTYIDISPLNTLKDTTSILDPGTPSSILPSYVFTEGDRIRFITEKDGTLLQGTYDYEIKGYVSEITDSDGNIYFKDTIYVSKITDWLGDNIGEGSTYEIYTPKKQFSDDIYYEIGEVFTCSNGTILTTSGTLSDGDIYTFNRDMSAYIIGELVSDKVLGREDYAYSGNAGIVPKLDVIKSAEGIYPEAMVIPGKDADVANVYFYKNTTGSSQTVTVSGSYNIITETDNGCSFVLRHMASNDSIKQTRTIYTVPNTNGGTIITEKGTISYSITVSNNEYLYFYFDVPGKSNIFLHSPVNIEISVKITDFSISGSVESRHYSDYWQSDEHSYGRPYLELEENTTTKNSIVNTGKYFVGTDMNQINLIDSLNVKNVPYEHGLITGLLSRGDTLKVLCPDKEISFYLGKEEYMTGGGQRQLALTDSFIGTMRPYETDYGTENPESIMVDGSDVYYYDKKNKTIICSSKNGQIDIGRYGAKTYLSDVTARLYSFPVHEVFIGSNVKNDEILIVFTFTGSSVLPSGFVALSAGTGKTWVDLSSAPNGDIYACSNNGDIYKRTNGTGAFTALGQTSRDWARITVAPNGNVYACTYSGDIYKQTAGAGNFVALSQTSRLWRGLTAAPNGDIYASVYNGDIYKQTAGTGDFIALSQTTREWSQMCSDKDGNIYCCEYGDGIYKQTGGTGNFVLMVGSYIYCNDVASDSDGNLYVISPSGNIYKQNYGESVFTLYLSINAQIPSSITVAENDDIYVADQDIDIYYKSITPVASETSEIIVFNKVENAWKHRLEYSDSLGNVPMGMINYGETFIIYVNGNSFLNEAGATFNTFFGSAKESTINFVLNTEPVNTKVLRSLSFQGKEKWEIEISGDSDTQYPQGTYTKIPISRFKEKEGIYHSDVPANLKDKTGTVSLLRYAKGQPMRGRYFDVTLTNSDTTQVQLDLITVNYENQ